LKVSKEIKTGVIAIFIIVLSIWGYSFMKNKSLTSKTRLFYSEYNTVEGLAKNSPVTINGFKVGKISNITFHKSKRETLVVEMDIDNDVNFSRNSVAQIYSPDFISGKSLRIKMVYDNAEIAKSGDTLKGEISSGIIGMINEQIGPLQTMVEEFIVHSDTVMKNINYILNPQNQKNIQSSLDNLNKTLITFKNLSYKADHLLADNNTRIDSIMSNANISMQKISQLSSSLEKADLSATIAKLQETLDGFNRLLDSVENGEGTIGLLMKDESLYNNLDGASKELEALLRDMKEHPKRFVHFSLFGKKEKSYEDNVIDQPEK
jgi:phospholipid/cholesterol/gamma-HCH transport system substrate-binding protein